MRKDAYACLINWVTGSVVADKLGRLYLSLLFPLEFVVFKCVTIHQASCTPALISHGVALLVEARAARSLILPYLGRYPLSLSVFLA